MSVWPAHSTAVLQRLLAADISSWGIRLEMSSSLNRLPAVLCADVSSSKVHCGRITGPGSKLGSDVSIIEEDFDWGVLRQTDFRYTESPHIRGVESIDKIRTLGKCLRTFDNQNVRNLLLTNPFGNDQCWRVHIKLCPLVIKWKSCRFSMIHVCSSTTT